MHRHLAARHQVVAAQPLVGPQQRLHVGGQVAQRRLLKLEHVPVKIRRPPHSLAGIVDNKVEPRARGQKVLAKRFDAGRMPQIQAKHLEPVAPIGKIGLLRIALGSIAGKAGRHNQVRTGPQQFDARLIANLYPTTCEQCHPPAQIGGLAALVPVQLGTGRAQLVIKGVNRRVLLLTHVTMLQVGGLSRRLGLAVVDRVEKRLRGRKHVGRDKHGLTAQGANSGVGAQILVALHLVELALATADLVRLPALVKIGAKHVAGGGLQARALVDTQPAQ